MGKISRLIRTRMGIRIRMRRICMEGIHKRMKQRLNKQSLDRIMMAKITAILKNH